MKGLTIAACACVAATCLGHGFEVRTHSPADRVAVTEDGDALVIDYSILPDVPRITGCFRYNGGWADLLLREPRTLAPGDERIVFEWCEGKPISGGKVLLCPLVRDEDGEMFVYMSKFAPQLRGRTDAWRLMTTPNFYAGEAGSASEKVFELDGEGVDFRPGEKLELLGFRLLVRLTDLGLVGEKARREGRVALGAFRPGGAVYPYSHPFAYADNFLTKSGRYTFAVQVRNEFQGVPVREFAQKIVFDAESFYSRKQRLEIPLGPNDNYWIDYRVIAEDGSAVKSEYLRYEVQTNPDATPLRPVDTSVAPPAGWMRLNPDHPKRGVFERGERPRIEVRTFLEEGDDAEIRWRLMPCAFPDVLAEGRSAAKGRGSVWIEPPVLEGRSAYRLEVSLVRSGKTIDRGGYIYGFRTDRSARHDRPGAIVDRRKMKERPYNRTTFHPGLGSKEYAKTETEHLKRLQRFLDESHDMATSFTYMLDLCDAQVLEGVYDTYLLDRVMDAAADAGCRVTVRTIHSDGGDGLSFYKWNKYDRQLASDGTQVPPHRAYGVGYSVADERIIDFWLDFYRFLYDRYREHCAFEGYYVMDPAGETIVCDLPWEGVVSGYDESTKRLYRKWLDERYGGDHSGAEPPQPDFRLGVKADLRPEWLDFCRFKVWLSDFWMKTSVEAIRSFDDDRVIIAYTNPKSISAIVGDKLDYAHNGGNHPGTNLGEYIEAWNRHRVGWISEPHAPHAWASYGDPSDSGWTLDWTLWVATAQAAGGGSNIHVYFRPWAGSSLLDAFGGVQAYDLFERLKPVLSETHDMELLSAPVETAFLSDRMTMFAKHKSSYGGRLGDLRRWRELAQADSVPTVNYDLAHRDEYRLLLPNLLDEVIEKSTFEAVVEHVRRGGRAVITARTGSLVPEIGGAEPFQLLKALGIPTPASSYCRKGGDVTAVASASDFFNAGTRIPFETADRQHQQLLDPQIQNDFFNYRWRWVPETDYFGYYPGVRFETEGPGRIKVLATFDDGGVAASVHSFGKGEVVVFWGTPDINSSALKGFVSAAAKWAGVSNPLAGCSVTRYLEGRNARLGRHYLMLWHATPGEYAVPVAHVPDGDYFLDDMISNQRLGRYDGRTLRENGLSLRWVKGCSPLKYVRMIPVSKAGFGPNSDWCDKYAVQAPTADDDLVRLFARAEKGGALRAVAMGGSITQAGKGWIGDWLARRFPKCRTMMFNAGMSATGSSLGVFRLGRDVIACRPDLVLIEFCVNDGGLSDEDAVRFTESLVVRLKSLPDPPAIVFVGAASRGRITFERHRRVAERYGLKFIDLQKPLEKELKAKGLAWTDLMSDDVHPNEAGHRFYAKCIVEALEPFAQAAGRGTVRPSAGTRPLPPPLSAKRLVLDGEMVSVAESPRDGWRCVPSVGKWWDKFLSGVLQAPKATGTGPAKR